ncbi:SdpI family protein [Streptomyces somaliensis]|uniref:SdpI family protein n=1 Tax=Streptomyces somaliensis TaxID=78355 RepID=UPI0020CCBACF|nr:SdpI family protein [Streptomyces somaliensis]MCP9944031.1 SdpI family protein [Streptomyces somaliensis]MCP9962730.1 SdpI family protein [Streptomyces somaliensis]MCP9975564.1 SdpI family protein [Streptomyces somaliensis]
MENAGVHVVGGQVADPVAGLVFGLGLMALGVAIHCVKSKVASGSIQRNSAIGIRTKATMSSDSAWQAGHVAAAPMLTATFLTAYAMGVISLALGLMSTLSDAKNTPVMVIPPGGLVTVLALLVVAAIKANSVARAVGHSDM